MATFVVVEDRSGKTGFSPRGAALELWNYKGPEVICSGAAESAKTYGACQKLDALLWNYPGARGLMARKSYKALIPSALQTYLRKVIVKDAEKNGLIVPFGGERPSWFDYANGSRLYISGLDDPDTVMSTEFDFAFVNQCEELRLDDWEKLLSRTTGRAGNAPYAQLMGDCNPGPPTHWIKQRKTLKLLEARHQDNPMLYDSAGNITEQGKRTMAALDALTGVRKERLRYGRWVTAEGVVYETFDTRIHLVGKDQLPATGTTFASVDFGFTNAGVILVWRLDGDGRMFLMHEVYQTGKLIEWWVAKGKALKGQYGIECFVCDPSEPAYIEQFVRAGLYAVQAVNDVAPGIQAVQARLALAADGRPRLFLYEGALEDRDESLAEARQPCCLREELEAYSWPKSADGRPIKEVPVKMFDHGADALRYAVLWADARGRVAGQTIGSSRARGEHSEQGGRGGNGSARDKSFSRPPKW